MKDEKRKYEELVKIARAVNPCGYNCKAPGCRLARKILRAAGYRHAGLDERNLDKWVKKEEA